ncbi:hypothetical protein ACG0Z4_08075 [Enterocloster aldenensis]
MEVKFYDCMDVEDDKIKFAVIVARHMGHGCSAGIGNVLHLRQLADTAR